MKVAYIANPYLIHDCKWINRLSSSLDKVVVIASCKAGRQSYLNSSIKIYDVVPNIFSAINIVKRNQIVNQIKSILKEEGIDIVHSMYAVPNSMWANLAIDKKHKHIITTRGSDMLVDYSITYKNPNNLREKIAYSIMRSMIEKTVKRADCITSTSVKQSKVLESILRSKTKLNVIRTGVDVEFYLKEIEQVKKKASNKIVIFSPRSMKPIYNIDILLEAIGIVVRTKPELKEPLELKIIVDIENEYANEQKARIKTLNIENNVIILGSQKQNEMIKHYVNADITVMVPKSDGTPVSAIESMICKTPLIVGDVDYDADIFNDDTVWSLSKTSAENLASKLIEVIALSDEDKQTKVETAYKAANDLANLSKSVETVNNLYKAMLHG